MEARAFRHDGIQGILPEPDPHFPATS